ncbi:MAG: hypoxanthine phosphoribosyltransferase [Proteobacteria bacterium]|nr:hypoxanthine phosphoribosyltransferase [Pseudomonadota bacterium]
MQRIMFARKRIEERVAELGQEISNAYRGKEIVMVVLLRGSFIFAADLIRVLEPEVVVDFMVVSSYQGKETSGEVRIIKDLSENIHDRHVLVVEDIVDTGLTMSKILEVLKSRSPKSLEICTLLNKPDRRIKEIGLKYIGFSIDDKFVVGYGLDVDQKYRQLPYIAELSD